MGRVLLYALSAIGALAVLAAMVGIVWVGGQRRQGLPDRLVLEVDWSQGLDEQAAASPLAQALSGGRLTVAQTVVALERAAQDDRVQALIVRIGSGFRQPAKVQELRDAVLGFRSEGKRAVAWVEAFGTGNSGTINYYLATVFDEIHLLPLGSVKFNGLSMESPFFADALDKLGIEPHVDSRSEYKSAKNLVTDTRFTEPHRESYARITESWFARIAGDVADARGLSRKQVDTIAAGFSLDSDQALAAGLIDAIGFRDEVYAGELERTAGAELLYLKHYMARSERPPEDSPVLALIYGVGNVVQGESRTDPISGVTNMGSDTVAAAFRAAMADDDVKAILFRIDSGGGSAIASQLMWRETQRAREKGKPVIVSMGDVAGSGGYWIAMGADRIVAQPGTITGSIGVVSGKLITHKFWDDLGITFDEVQTHPNASMWNPIRDFTPEQWQQFQSQLDDIYERFLEGVAQGRGLPMETVQHIARGRIWTGSDALELGLVDELGGFPAAIRLAREAAGIEEEASVRLQIFPRPKSRAEALLAQLTGQQPSNSGSVHAELAVGVLEWLRPLGKLANQLGWTGTRGEVALELPLH